MNRTKNLITILVTALVLTAGTAFAENNGNEQNKKQATQWQVDKAHTNVQFEVTHFFTPVTGTFDQYSGEIYFNPDNLEESSVNFEIDVASINTRNKKRDDHLRSDDFFYAEKYPKITFASDKIEKTGSNKFVAHGTLSMRGTSKEIELPFELLGSQKHPMKKNTIVSAIKAETTLSRTAYDVGVGDWASNAVIGDDVDVTIAMEMTTKEGNM